MEAASWSIRDSKRDTTDDSGVEDSAATVAEVASWTRSASWARRSRIKSPAAARTRRVDCGNVANKDPVGSELKRLSWRVRKRRRHRSKSPCSSLENKGKTTFREQKLTVSNASGSRPTEQESIVVDSKCRLAVDCRPEDAQGCKTATADGGVSPKAAKQDLSDASEDCAMPDDHTKPPLPRMQAKQSHLPPEKPYLPTLAPVTKIGSSFEELRNYKIPKVKQRQPPTEERSSRIFQSPDVSQRSKQKCENPEHQEELTQSHSSSSSIGRLPSSGLLDKIIEDMNKAYPKVQGCYVECGNRCPTQNKAGKFPKSPTIHPPVHAKGIGWKGSGSTALDRTPFSSHINQKQPSKICVMCKRRSVSEAGGTDTCIRCSLCKQITKEQAAVKEQATKEKLTVPVRDVSAKINVRRGSSDVENKEQVTRIPTSPPSSRIRSTKDKVNTTPVKENKKKTTHKRLKAPLSRPVISSSDDSSNGN
ncbi:hypothetical protein HPB50_021504 [Hyalomma asiaticum]|uniref:Uncharacterized protein n=1 Tax=Hyalomma asiaticum TaxID=266040 RepID=A0ACB7SG83_HYAAI|nr:hypothetical protein HPB50_021504 [Hyalomma asiaticum]